MDRRKFLMAGAGAICATGCDQPFQTDSSFRRMIVKPSSLKLFPGQSSKTKIWGYDGVVAGPQFKMRRGETFRLNFVNQIPQPTSIHWHGLRIPFEMDGVGSITQPGIKTGETYPYEFAPPDAGLFWYHPHMNSEVQLTRGMFGLIVVEEDDPPPADREVIWSLYNWGLGADFQTPEEKAFQLWRGTQDYAPNKKLTTNGIDAPDLIMRRGERVRLRIANTSGIKRYALRFEGHDPWVIAWDGNGVEPYRLGGQPLTIGTGARVDLMLDGVGEAGRIYAVTDVFNLHYEPVPPWATPEEIASRAPEHLCNIVYSEQSALREIAELPPATPPPPNHIAEPDLSEATPIDIELSNYMTPIKDVPKIGPMAALLAAQHGISPDKEVTLWTMNGDVLLEDLDTYYCIDPKPLFECKLGRSYLLRFINQTNVDHPMHLHGHTFKMVRRNGEPYPENWFRDTFTVFGGDTIEVAFLADNPGDWMIHCHRAMHMHSGMMSLFRVS